MLFRSGDTRTGYKAWSAKLKNALVAARGPEWRTMLVAVENYRVSSDFEELVSLDDQWDDWFEKNFGFARVDGHTPIDLHEVKSDLAWVLTDKLGENLAELIRKHEQNGLRSYKKLYTWSVDLVAMQSTRVWAKSCTLIESNTVLTWPMLLKNGTASKLSFPKLILNVC